MKFFERFYPFLTAAIIILLVIYLSPTDLTGRYDNTKAMASLDVNGNEILESSEISSVRSFFMELDKNDDNSTDFTECLDHLDLASLLDINEDHKLDLSELENAQSILNGLDRNEDGDIDLKELK